MRESLAVAVEDRGWEAEAVASGEQALARLPCLDVAAAALRLGIARTTLDRKIEQYRLRREG